MTFEFGILGPLEVRAGGAPVHVGGARARALLALLLLHPNEPVSADAAATALWGADAPSAATKAVQVHVSRLRKALGDGDALATTGGGYALRVRPGELDAERFARVVEEGREALAAGRPDEAAARLRDALALWRGPPLADVPFEPFRADVAALEEQRLAALEAWVRAELECGRHAELVPELRRLVAAHPLREGLHAGLMLALYRSGRQADALDSYRRARATLVDELGIEPGAELRELERAILEQSPALAHHEPAVRPPPARPPPDSGPAPPGRIPAAATPTVGRGEEVARLCAALDDPATRLVTVVGPGGVGKTRLAADAARTIAPRFSDGAWFVALAGVRGHEHVASTIARTLDVSVMRGESLEEALARRLARRQLLLVLDNFEHVLDAAPLVADLLAAAPDLHVLATSREPLHLRAERLFHLEPLAVSAPADGGEAPAVALFAAAARARDDAFELREADSAAIRIVCRRLDGLPLAIELAAARVGMLAPAELAERLGGGLEALGTGPRDAPARQRTLAATLEWSHELLTEPERDAFSALSVFAGGATVDAATAVTGAPLDVLEALVEKNLVRAHAARGGGRRLEMLETIRELARARLDARPDADAIHRRHLEHYLTLAENARPELERTGSTALLSALDLEVNNFRAALGWALERRDAVRALRLGAALALYWRARELDREGARWLGAALALDEGDVPVPVRAAALEAHAHSLDEAGEYAAAEEAARASLELWRSVGDLSGQARSLSRLAGVRMMAHRLQEAYGMANEAQRLAREAGDDFAREGALRIMAIMAPTLQEALALGGELAAAWRASGRWRDLAMLQSSLAYTALCYGDQQTAKRLSTEALEIAAMLGAPGVEALARGNVGLSELLAGDPWRARENFARELELGDRTGLDKFAFEALNGLAAVAAAAAEDELAATLAGAADAVASDRHDPVIAAQLEERFLAPARRRLGEGAWQAAYAVGAGMDREHAAALAVPRGSRVS